MLNRAYVICEHMLKWRIYHCDMCYNDITLFDGSNNLNNITWGQYNICTVIYG